MCEDKRENWWDEPEAEEVVSWYDPSRREGEEVVCSYSQDIPLPEHARPLPGPEEPVRKRRKKRKKGLWIFLGCLLLLAVVIGLALWAAEDEDSEKQDNASSIVDTGEVETSIPRVKGSKDVQLQIVPAETTVLAPQEIYEKVNPSTVAVVAEGEEGASVGTGVIMTSDGYIITNAHVISGSKECWIALASGKTYDAKLVGFDEPQDLAVLKVEPKEELAAAEFGDSLTARVGDTVYAIGNPLGLNLRGSMTDGMLSAVDRNMDMNGGTAAMLQTTAALNSGNSGGPLINAAGQVIGINTLKMSNRDLDHEATVEGLGFALPATDIKPVVDRLIDSGKFDGLPVLGVTVINATIEDAGERVLVITVSPGGGADEAGLQPDDMILAMNGQPVSHIDDLLTVRRDFRVGDTVTLTIQREGKVFDAEVTLHSDREAG